MAEDAYLQRAASEIRDAIAALQSDIRRIQRDAYDHELRLNGEISNAEYQVTTLKAEHTAEQSMNDRNRANQSQNQIRQLEAMIGQKKQEAGKTSSDAASVVQAKTDLMNRLGGLLPQIESLIAAAR